MGHYLDTLEHRKAFQAALNASLGNQLKPPLKIDGDLGNKSAAAVRLWRQVNGKVLLGKDGQPMASVNDEMLRLLGLGPALITEPGTLGNTIALPIIELAAGAVLPNILKGTGIIMDFAKVSKAIAGGLSGAGIGGAGAAYTYISLPPAAQDVLPHWVPVAIPIANMVIGFAVGFSVVYFAPANKTA